VVIRQLQDEDVSCGHVIEQQAGEISMHVLVMRNEMSSLENIRPGNIPILKLFNHHSGRYFSSVVPLHLSSGLRRGDWFLALCSPMNSFHFS